MLGLYLALIRRRHRPLCSMRCLLTSSLEFQTSLRPGPCISLYRTNTRTSCTIAHFSAIDHLPHEWSARCPITPTPRSLEPTRTIINPRDLHRKDHGTPMTMLSPHRSWLDQMSSRLTTRGEALLPQRQPHHCGHCRVV